MSRAQLSVRLLHGNAAAAGHDPPRDAGSHPAAAAAPCGSPSAAEAGWCKQPPSAAPGLPAPGDLVSHNVLEGSPHARFEFLRGRVLRCQIWRDDDGALFEQLKEAAQALMDQIACRCNARCGEGGALSPIHLPSLPPSLPTHLSPSLSLCLSLSLPLPSRYAISASPIPLCIPFSPASPFVPPYQVLIRFLLFSCLCVRVTPSLLPFLSHASPTVFFVSVYDG